MLNMKRNEKRKDKMDDNMAGDDDMADYYYWIDALYIYGLIGPGINIDAWPFHRVHSIQLVFHFVQRLFWQF